VTLSHHQQATPAAAAAAAADDDDDATAAAASCSRALIPSEHAVRALTEASDTIRRRDKSL